MRLILAAAALCACTALAQFENENDYDYDDELQERNVRDATWEAAHGGKAPSYHGFEEMAQNYPGHPMKSWGTKHHARDVEDESGLGDDDGFIDATANFANNVARAVKGAYQHAGQKAEEAVEHAKAKAGYENDWRQFQKAGEQHGGSQHWARDVEGEEDFPEGYDFEDDYDFDDEQLSSILARDVGDEDEDDEEIDWDPSTRYDDEEASHLAARDLSEDDDEDNDDEPAATAFDDDDDDEDVLDPKLELEQEFDEGLVERDEGGLFERDAEPEPFNFFGFGGKKHDGPKDAEHEAMKKGMKHVFARDGGLSPEDEELDGAYDPISEDPNISDDEFYGAAEELEKRSMPHIIDGDYDDDLADFHIPLTPSKTKTKTSTSKKHKASKTPAPTKGGWFW